MTCRQSVLGLGGASRVGSFSRRLAWSLFPVLLSGFRGVQGAIGEICSSTPWWPLLLGLGVFWSTIFNGIPSLSGLEPQRTLYPGCPLCCSRQNLQLLPGVACRRTFRPAIQGLLRGIVGVPASSPARLEQALQVWRRGAVLSRRLTRGYSRRQELLLRTELPSMAHTGVRVRVHPPVRWISVKVVIWAIELVRVLELAASTFLWGEDSDRLWVLFTRRMRSNSSSMSPMCFRTAVFSPAKWVDLSRLDQRASWAFSSRKRISFTVSFNLSCR